jgi:hypothetical protein
MDRRATFFLVSAVLCAVLLWPCPRDLRWVGWVLVGGFFVLALLSTFESLARKRRT